MAVNQVHDRKKQVGKEDRKNYYENGAADRVNEVKGNADENKGPSYFRCMTVNSQHGEMLREFLYALIL